MNGQQEAASERVPAYSWYALGVLVLVYVLNFIDRQILSILANDIKRDLGVDDAYLGFLYGTAFAIFYALFGIPLGRLADSWKRVRLMTLGLTLWSGMTALSGFARDASTLSVARIGVGVGEATASPSAYSLISDWFPARLRATALAIYSSGLYIGGGVSLAIGGFIVDGWNRKFPSGDPLLGLAGWQAAFVAVGLPGLLLAVWVATLREPIRGAIDGLTASEDPHPFRGFVRELYTIIPGFTFFGAAARGWKSLLLNVVVFVGALAAAHMLTVALGSGQGAIVAALGSALGVDLPIVTDQWLLLALGYYAVFCWASALRIRDYPTFALTWGSPAFLCTILGYGTVAFMAYSASYWGAPYAERTFLDVSKAELGFLLGGGGAVGGFLGVILGGRLADALLERFASGRVWVIIFGLLSPVPFAVFQYTTDSWTLFVVLNIVVSALAASALGAAAATSQSLVLPRMRGTATATFFLATTLVGLALGPYLAGYVSARNDGNLSTGVLATLWITPIGLALLITASRLVPAAAASIAERARSAGEP
ncbi:Major Facilitator Superfamily protein [Erythrobacter litoralis]|jgi:MFS family permease|nr:MFS transporter [Erythrobacter litoralis]AOL22217.1 Major Facilitator Superfamily protein [Erythrobacter litoralis]MEE4337457.1 MFS transporter [Erythrobacter sp.]